MTIEVLAALAVALAMGAVVLALGAIFRVRTMENDQDILIESIVKLQNRLKEVEQSEADY